MFQGPEWISPSSVSLLTNQCPTMEPYDDVILQYPMYDVTNLSLLFAQLLQILNLGLCDEQVTFQLRTHLKLNKHQ